MGKGAAEWLSERLEVESLGLTPGGDSVLTPGGGGWVFAAGLTGKC
ncbi:MAG: hypothetical protein ACOY0T_24805 [Myxococcota bacterium]